MSCEPCRARSGSSSPVGEFLDPSGSLSSRLWSNHLGSPSLMSVTVQMELGVCAVEFNSAR